MRSSKSLALSALLFGCSVTRPDQGNFEIDASKGSIEAFVSVLSTRFDASAEHTALDIPDSDPSEMFTLEGRDATIVVIAEPDDRCNPNAPRHATYHRKLYRADLVSRTRSQPTRMQAQQKLIGSAKQVGLPIQPFKEC
jgi:hypothetical protein